jgi:hypothetical protein
MGKNNGVWANIILLLAWLISLVLHYVTVGSVVFKVAIIILPIISILLNTIHRKEYKYVILFTAINILLLLYSVLGILMAVYILD